MRRLLLHVAQTIASKRLLPPGAPVLVAVSGGLDSMVLLDLLRQLAVTQERSTWAAPRRC